MAGNMDSKLLKFIGYLPDYVSALSRRLLRFFWTTFVETAVCYMFVQRLFTNCMRVCLLVEGRGSRVPSRGRGFQVEGPNFLFCFFCFLFFFFPNYKIYIK